jgi:putative transport protein
MNIFENLFRGFPDLWGGGVAHSVMILSLVITLGLFLGKIKVRGVSLGRAWILFVGLIFGYFYFYLDQHLLHFLKEFGLILFIYSIGLEIGPGFFSSFKKSGKTLNALVAIIISLSIVTALTLCFSTGTPVTTIAGILSGAVTSTPGLGTAQQAFSDLRHIDDPTIATGYAVAYPMGILGVVLSFMLLRVALKIDSSEEDAEAQRGRGHLEDKTVNTFSVRIDNAMIAGKTVKHIHELLARDFIFSRICRADSTEHQQVVNGHTVLNEGDTVLVVARPADQDPICAMLGTVVDMDWTQFGNELVVRRVLVTRSGILDKSIAQLNIRSNFGVNITHINRSGVELVATPDLKLQMGDSVTVVGSELGISHTEKTLGSSSRQMAAPNLIPIFLGLVLGCILANVPFVLPGISETLRLGLTGGPLVIAMLIGFFGPKYNFVNYSTMNANLMLREFGLYLFLACIGLGTGKDFVNVICTMEGLRWIAFGLAITMIPIIIGGIIGRLVFHINYYTLMGVLAGANTNVPALAYANDGTESDLPSVGYATVYPFAMFLRIITIQIMIFALA